MRNAFAEVKITYIENTGQVLYCSDMTHGKNNKNFELLPAEEFIARVTQHIPEKGFQMVRTAQLKVRQRRFSPPTLL